MSENINNIENIAEENQRELIDPSSLYDRRRDQGTQSRNEKKE